MKHRPIGASLSRMLVWSVERDGAASPSGRAEKQVPRNDGWAGYDGGLPAYRRESRRRNGPTMTPFQGSTSDSLATSVDSRYGIEALLAEWNNGNVRSSPKPSLPNDLERSLPIVV